MKTKSLDAALRERTVETGAIVVGATPTERGQRAARAAAAVCKQRGDILEAYRIIREESTKEEAEAVLGEVTSMVSEANRDTEVGASVHVTRFPEQYTDADYGRAVCLVDAATSLQAELIVIGSHDLGKGRKPLSGTMTQKLLQYAPCPVLIAANEPPRPYRRVLVAVDFSAVSFEAVRAASRFAPGAEIHVVHVAQGGISPESAGGMTSLIEALIADTRKHAEDETGATFLPKVVSGKAGPALSSAVSDLSPDLLVLGTRGSSPIARLVLGSVAARFVDEPPCDLLLLRSPE